MPFPVRRILLGLALLTLLPHAASARAMHMMDSTPKAESTVNGQHERYIVRFDGPVDHRGSSLRILHEGRLVRILHPLLNAAPEVLFASGRRLPAGTYELAWSVKSAPDGEVTQGSIPFTVSGPR
ncbi:MAG: copper resistance protein CopC [Acetobacteraceae bacterium]